MIRFQVLHGVELSGATSLPTVTRTDEGRAMGAVPGWGMFGDPAYVYLDDNTMLNRASGAITEMFFPENPINLGSFPDSGAPAIDMSQLGFAVYGSSDVNPASHTLFAVLMLDAEHGPGDAQIRNMGYGNGAYAEEDGEITLNWGYLPQTSSLTVREHSVGANNTAGQSSARLNAVVGDVFGETHLFMMTFSTRDGLKLFLDGELVGENKDDKRPLTRDFNAGEWTMFRNCRGYYGMHGLINIDLGWPEHAGYRRSIERFLMGKYGIS